MTRSFSELKDLREAVEGVSRALSTSFRRVIDALPGRPQRPGHIARSVGANPNLAHRLCTAIGKLDPIETLLTMPGPVPLTQFADAARAHGVAGEICESAKDAVREFESLVHAVGNDRVSFDAVLSEWVPSARAQQDATARQSVYRGLRQIRGASAETHFFVSVMHPSAEDALRLDVLVLSGDLGVERLRSSGRFVLTDEVRLVNNAAAAESGFRVLPEYCSMPAPSFETAGVGAGIRYFLEWHDSFGKASSRDIVLAGLHRKGFVRRRASESAAFGAVTTRPNLPSRQMVFDLMLHRDALSGCIPYFRAYAPKWGGMNSPNNPLDDLNIIPQDAEVQSVRDGGLDELSTPEVPFYHRMLAEQCGRLGWDLSQFRAFRVRMDYPLLDADLQFVIPLPEQGG